MAGQYNLVRNGWPVQKNALHYSVSPVRRQWLLGRWSAYVPSDRAAKPSHSALGSLKGPVFAGRSFFVLLQNWAHKLKSDLLQYNEAA
jgi:hypothetical protein